MIDFDAELERILLNGEMGNVCEVLRAYRETDGQAAKNACLHCQWLDRIRAACVLAMRRCRHARDDSGGGVGFNGVS